MARKKAKTAQSIFEQLKVDMQGLAYEERVKLVELVLADPDFGNGPAWDLLHLEMQGIAARVEAQDQRAKNSRRSRKADDERNAAVLADRAAGLSYGAIAKKHKLNDKQVEGIIRRAKKKGKLPTQQ